MKLSLEALKERAEAVASEELLATISGGVENACHDNSHPYWDNFSPAGNALLDWLGVK